MKNVKHVQINITGIAWEPYDIEDLQENNVPYELVLNIPIENYQSNIQDISISELEKLTIEYTHKYLSDTYNVYFDEFFYDNISLIFD